MSEDRRRALSTNFRYAAFRDERIHCKMAVPLLECPFGLISCLVNG